MRNPRSFLRGFVFIAASTSAFACGQDLPGPQVPARNAIEHQLLGAQVAAAAAAHRDSAFRGRVARGIEDHLLRLEHDLPGLGGVYVTETGELGLWLPSAVDPSAARARIAAVAAVMNVPPAVRQELIAGRLQIREPRFRFSELVAYTELLSGRLFSIPGVTLLDADESLNRVRVGVATSQAGLAVSDLAAALALPEGLVVVTHSPMSQEAVSLRDTFNQMGGAIQIQTSAGGGRCSLGFNVSSDFGHLGFITAGHCAGGMPGSGTVGTQIHQPLQPRPVGQIAVNPQWIPHQGSYEGATYTRVTQGDAMLVSGDPGVSLGRMVAFTAFRGDNGAGGSITVTGWWSNITWPSYAFVGQQVDKNGRTTGWTRGTVSGTCVSHVVPDSWGNRLVTCSDVVSGSRVGQGDSGGPVFIPPPDGQPSGVLYPLGILIAASHYDAIDWSDGGTQYCTVNCSYYFSNWDQINSRLGMNVYPNFSSGGGGGGGHQCPIEEPGCAEQ